MEVQDGCLHPAQTCYQLRLIFKDDFILDKFRALILPQSHKKLKADLWVWGHKHCLLSIREPSRTLVKCLSSPL